MNILILTAGSRVQTVTYFKRALAGRGKVIVTDASELAPALYVADRHYVVPLIKDPGYLDVVLDICRREEVSLVLSLLDPELSVLAANVAAFEALGAQVMISPAEVVERSFDKWLMYQWLCAEGFATPTSWIELSEVEADLAAGRAAFPLFVKARTGSASAGATRIDDLDQLRDQFDTGADLIVQEFMPGEPIDVDVFVDLISGEVAGMFAKKKLRMRAGTADKSVSFKDPCLFRLVADFVQRCGFRGVIDVDLFSTPHGWSILEVNPRFGGVYPHAYECGVDFPTMLLNNLQGVANQPTIGAYEEGWAMLGYDGVIMHRVEGVAAEQKISDKLFSLPDALKGSGSKGTEGELRLETAT